MSISGRGCLSHTLNAEEANFSKIYSFNLGRFSTTGLQGNGIGPAGGNVLRGHWHDVSLPTPVLVHFTFIADTDAADWSCWI